MKRCPSCNRTYTDTSLNFCLEDGTPLAVDAPPPSMPGATVRYPPARDTAEPPPTEIFRPDSPLISQPPPPPQQQWTPVPTPPPRKKSNAVWWILGGLAAFAVIGIGAAVLIFMLASISSTNTNNGNTNANVVVSNRNASSNANTNANANSNTNSSNLPSEFTDDFSQQKWGTGESKFGRIWYADDEYHMSSKAKTYVAIYAPSQQYQTANATIKVTGRSVDGSVPSAGFGLMIHCAKSKEQQLEDYALLIYPSDDPEYEIIMHKNGTQSSLVPKTKSSAIRSGTSPNQFEVRVKGTDMAFYMNGQLLTHINDAENYKGGVAGLYTSDTTEVAFDDLEITRNKD